jgi:hypothetical protein
MEEELHIGTLIVMDQRWQKTANDMAKQLVVMESGASTNGDLDAMDDQLEMLAYRIKKKHGEVQKLQKK